MGNATFSNGNHNALHTAAKCGNVAEVQSLVGKFDINAKGEDDGTALYWVAREGHTDVFKLLLTYNPDVNIPNNDGNTALIIASRWGHTTIAVALSQRADINVNHVNNNGDTALMEASYNGRTAIAVALSQHADINVNHVNKQGKSSIWLAFEGGHFKIVETLAEAGADVNQCRKFDGNTLLHLYSQRGNADLVAVLMASNASLTVKNKQDQSPIDAAANHEIRQLINNEMTTRFDHGLKRAVSPPPPPEEESEAAAAAAAAELEHEGGDVEDSAGAVSANAAATSVASEDEESEKSSDDSV